jgi:hypothetical protein
MTVITMSRNELMRLRVLIDVGDGRLSGRGRYRADRRWPKTDLPIARCVSSPPADRGRCRFRA